MLNWLKARQINRRIANFSPNKKLGDKLVKKRIKPFILSMISILILELIAIIVLWLVSGIDKVKIMTLALILLHALETVTFFVIFDNGAAQRLKKNNFKINGKKINKGHTYYYALKKSGFIRLIINVIFLMLIFANTLMAFFL